MWEATYFDWMDNIRDWCISRQIWWGHRIPVWYCDDCGEVIAATDDPDKCPKCGGKSLKQDDDVLDTWFSSALWPFSTLGWPDETDALKTFYPTSLLITGFDILFFWVARMMMMGLYVMKDVPFRDVYLHALVRDEKGEKMSKSKGNSIDPLKMIDVYGADALRFTLAAFTAQGRDVKISEARIEGYRHFVNKIWNASRFSMMNLEDYTGEGGESTEDYTICDRWIKSRLNRAVADITQSLDEYRFNDAAGRIYQFVWHEFCDWYLEFVKPVLYGKGSSGQRIAAQQTLLMVLKNSLKLIHPFMPFVTEEIWQKVAADEGSIVTSSYPVADDIPVDEEAEYLIDTIMNITSSIRNIRGEMNIPPSRKLKVLISAPDDKLASEIAEGKNYIVDLANLEELDVEKEPEEPKGVATGIVGSTKVYVFLEGMIDIAAEKARLNKDIKKIAGNFAAVSRKLNNEDFLKKASEDIIAKERAKFEELKERSMALEEALKRLEKIEGRA
jgi:valyl-tRNA synthetase